MPLDLQTGFSGAKCKNFNLPDFKEDELPPWAMFWRRRGKKQKPKLPGRCPIPQTYSSSYHQKLVDILLLSSNQPCGKTPFWKQIQFSIPYLHYLFIELTCNNQK